MYAPHWLSCGGGRERWTWWWWCEMSRRNGNVVWLFFGILRISFWGRTKVGGVGISYLPTNHNLCGKWGSGNERPLWPPIRIAPAEETTTYHGHSSHYYYDDDEGWTTRKLWFRKLNGMEMLFSSCGGCGGGWLMHCCSYLYNTSSGGRKQNAE